MALITVKKLRGLPVYTKSGDKLGKIADVLVDVENHEVRAYVVSKSNLLAALLPGDLQVARDQVISVTEERMTVHDAAVSERVAEELLPRVAALDGGATAPSQRTAE
ncbi:MAG: PRC-barrel domain [Candidatus Parcubacteria bacterium]|jgi:sporulation protein YlmC with PRC-barrel domain